MLQCTICKHENPPDSLHCHRCGALLDSVTLAQQAIQTASLTPQATDIREVLGLNEDRTYFGARSLVVLLTRNYPAPIEFGMTYDNAVTLGRQSTRMLDQVLVDLTVFGAFKLGVSRQHAQLVLRGHSLRIIDLDSTNGTFVNGSQLLPREQRGLNNGDTLQLGNLVMRVVFRHQN